MEEIDKLFSEEEVKQYLELASKRWVRVDPTTKAPHEAAKECFWQIDDVYPVCRYGGDMNKPAMGMVVVRYYRNQTYESAVSQDSSQKGTRHVAWHELNRSGELLAPGSIKGIEIADFLKQFVEDGKQVTASAK